MSSGLVVSQSEHTVHEILAHAEAPDCGKSVDCVLNERVYWAHERKLHSDGPNDCRYATHAEAPQVAQTERCNYEKEWAHKDHGD